MRCGSLSFYPRQTGKGSSEVTKAFTRQPCLSERPKGLELRGHRKPKGHKPFKVFAQDPAF